MYFTRARIIIIDFNLKLKISGIFNYFYSNIYFFIKSVNKNNQIFILKKKFIEYSISN